MRADNGTIALTYANIEIISGYFDGNEEDKSGQAGLHQVKALIFTIGIIEL